MPSNSVDTASIIQAGSVYPSDGGGMSHSLFAPDAEATAESAHHEIAVVAHRKFAIRVIYFCPLLDCLPMSVGAPTTSRIQPPSLFPHSDRGVRVNATPQSAESSLCVRDAIGNILNGVDSPTSGVV